MLLYGGCSDREKQIILSQPVPVSIFPYVIQYLNGNGECALLAGFLLYNIQPVARPVLYDVGQVQGYNVRDTQAEVCFKNKRGSNAVIRTEQAAPALYGADKFLVLFLGERNGFLVSFQSVSPLSRAIIL